MIGTGESHCEGVAQPDKNNFAHTTHLFEQTGAQLEQTGAQPFDAIEVLDWRWTLTGRELQ